MEVLFLFVKILSNFEENTGHKMKISVVGPKFESYEALLFPCAEGKGCMFLIKGYPVIPERTAFHSQKVSFSPLKGALLGAKLNPSML